LACDINSCRLNPPISAPSRPPSTPRSQSMQSHPAGLVAVQSSKELMLSTSSAISAVKKLFTVSPGNQ
jgi:hypothetical protein